MSIKRIRDAVERSGDGRPAQRASAPASARGNANGNRMTIRRRFDADVLPPRHDTATMLGRVVKISRNSLEFCGTFDFTTFA
jgi:hypothetical protein